jgi:hypothetical protein
VSKKNKGKNPNISIVVKVGGGEGKRGKRGKRGFLGHTGAPGPMGPMGPRGIDYVHGQEEQ